jgi:hypothetical protein
MAVIAPPPAPVKRVPSDRASDRSPTAGHLPPIGRVPVGGPGNGAGGSSGHGNGNSDGHSDADNWPPPPKKRRSIWPLLLDLGLVMMLFGLIIVGRFLIPIGAVVFVVALTGWIREARSDYSGLSE